MRPQTILITGAATGIGKASALALAARGHKVIATAKHREDLTNLEAEAKKSGLAMEFHELDITNDNQSKSVAEKFQIDAVFCNAAIGDTGPIAEMPLERVQANFEVNVVSTLRTVQSVVPQMINRKSGRIIIMSSMAGLVTPMFFSPYAASKAALESIANSLRNELKYFNIGVVVINPGRIDGGHNAKIAATKYDWLGPSSAYYPYINEMKKGDRMLLDNAYHIDTVVPVIIKAVESEHPKIRYAAPAKYRLGMFLARLVPTRLQDWILYRDSRLKTLK